MATPTANDIHGMAEHWLGTPTGAYLGSDYGSDLKALLMTPQAAGLADDTIRKLRQDVPIIGALPGNAVNVVAIPVPPDRLKLALEVVGELIPITGGPDAAAQ